MPRYLKLADYASKPGSDADNTDDDVTKAEHAQRSQGRNSARGRSLSDSLVRMRAEERAKRKRALTVTALNSSLASYSSHMHHNRREATSVDKSVARRQATSKRRPRAALSSLECNRRTP
ncbi:hypothetical protein E5D57_004013 [Metarhizium anisopliae]|nr:hypothetical protein E5D57_004013 [Metarhizium anisopliae]